LKIASDKNAKHNTKEPDVQLDINMAMMAGLCFTDIGVNGQSIISQSDTEDLELELVDVN